MINKHILNLKQEVPKDIRLEVYIKALESVKYTKDLVGKHYGLCLLFPILLWELNNYLDNAPNGEDWDWKETPIAFPELTKEVLNILGSIRIHSDLENKRIEYLEQFIEQLT